MSGGGKFCWIGNNLMYDNYDFLVELDLDYTESDADEFSSSSSMYITSWILIELNSEILRRRVF